MRILYTFVFMFMMMVGQIGAQTIIIGTGGLNTDGSGNDPIDDYFKYMRYQTVYTATELSTAGLTPYDILTGLGFSVSQSPGTLANYTIRIGHTTATNAAAHISAASTEVKSAFSYTPTVVSAGSFDMITFSTNFVWNGTDNIFIDICTGSNTFASPYGGVRVHTLTSGSRYVRSDGSSQCSNNTTTTNSNRPQIQFSYTDGTPPSCLPPSALTSSNITATTADISWTPPSPAPSNGYEYYYSTSNTPPGGSGTPTAGTSVSLLSLTSNTTYYFWVRSDCGGSGYSTWAGPASFTTQALTTPPWSEGFPSATLPAGWALSSYSGPSNSVTALSGTTTYYLYKNLYSSATTGSFTTINVGTLAGTENLSFTYKLANFSSPYGPPAIGSGNFVVAISTDFGATYTDIATESNNGVAGWQAKTYSLAGYAGQTVKVRITGNWTSGDYYLGFDDFKIETPPSCNPPSALTSSNITATTADISWTPPSPAPSNGYEYYYSTSNTPPGGSGTPTAGTSVSLLSLTSNTTYYFWVRSDCGGSGYSTWAGPASFKTACSPGSIPFTEGFESGYTDQTAVGGCWTQQSMAGAEVWTANSSLTSYNRTPRTGSFNAYLRWGNTDWLFYPLTLTGGTTYKFSVYARQDGSTSSDADITLAYGSTASDAGMTNVVVSAQGIVNGNYQEVTGNFTPASSGTYYIGIKGYINSSPFYISLDDISVIVAPTDAVDWCNLQHPPTGNITAGQNLTVYTQGYEPGVTPGTGAGSGISAWIGYSSSDTDPSGGGWTWVSATFNVEVGNNDEFKADIGSNLAPGTYYYASRWQLNGGPYKYGGYSSGGGGFWNGTTYVNGMLTINPLSNDECTGAIDVPVTPEVASQAVAGTILGATPSSGSFGSGCNIYSDNKDIWYKVTVPASGNVTIETFVTGGTSDSDNDYSFQVYSGSCGSLTYINCSEDANLYGTPASYMPALALTGQTPGATLYIRLRKSSSSSQTSFTIAAYDPTLTVPLATSDCSQGSVDVTVANGNGYRFVPLFDNSGNLIAELFAHGQDLGTVNASVYRNTTPPVRQDAAGVYYLDRDFTIKVTNQPSSNVDFYLWFTDAEFSA
ncbi:MAG TPA: fibronectin type III domain-containing protein, partial [Saprospiraceae bacterium]|nr:fibronectin type III domain-containing protein [Saprospiraceae bacterium]